MISLAAYSADPCATLSIPYWKAKSIQIPPHMKIVHDRDFSPSLLAEYEDERYFRLSRDLRCVERIALEDFEIRTAEEEDLETIVSVINRSYTDLQVTLSQIQSYRETSVFQKDLWVLVVENTTDCCVGCGIADCDGEAGELILEWIQVLPQYRRRKIGQAIVSELLHRGSARADFATVSGKVENPTNPERLYRKCGFVGDDVWHILTRK